MTAIGEVFAADHDSAQLIAAYRLRREVFVNEQGVPPELEVDEEDQRATHLVYLVDGQVVGTLRIMIVGETARIGRVAVHSEFRRIGIGRRLMEYADDIVSRKGCREIVLHAQLSVLNFYGSLGYCSEGTVEYEAGIAHIWMRKKVMRRY